MQKAYDLLEYDKGVIVMCDHVSKCFSSRGSMGNNYFLAKKYGSRNFSYNLWSSYVISSVWYGLSFTLAIGLRRIYYTHY